MHLARIVVLAALIATSVVLLVNSLDLLKSSGPYPTIVLGLCVGLLAATLATLLARPSAFVVGSEVEVLMRGPIDRHVRLLAFAAVWLGYAALLPVIGFILATTATLTATILLAGSRRPIWVLLCCFAAAVAMTILVKTALYVAVPEAALERWIELALFRLRN